MRPHLIHKPRISHFARLLHQSYLRACNDFRQHTRQFRLVGRGIAAGAWSLAIIVCGAARSGNAIHEVVIGTQTQRQGIDIPIVPTHDVGLHDRRIARVITASTIEIGTWVIVAIRTDRGIAAGLSSWPTPSVSRITILLVCSRPVPPSLWGLIRLYAAIKPVSVAVLAPSLPTACIVLALVIAVS